MLKAKEEKTLNPSEIIILGGLYSSGPFLDGLTDKTILVDVPPGIRNKRTSLRKGSAFAEQWHRRWDAVEAYYFEEVRPVSAFDWVVKG